MGEMMAEKKVGKDWTKIEIETVKQYLPKILLFFVIILPLIYIGYVAWINMNIPDVNSGVTVDTKTYVSPIENKTNNQPSTVSDAPSTVSDAFESYDSLLYQVISLLISLLPFMFIVVIAWKILGVFDTD
jgi:hypothetical protein